MIKKNVALLGIFIVTFGFVIGIIWGFGLSNGNVSEANKSNVAGSHSSEKMEELKAEIEKVTQYEMAYGCVEKDKNGEDVLCGDSKIKVEALNRQLKDEWLKLEKRNEKDIENVKSNIRKLAGKTSLDVEFAGTSSNPYTNNKKRIEFYDDSDGMTYLVDPETNKPVQFGPGSRGGRTFSEIAQFSLEELKKKAEIYLDENISDFDQVKKDFVYRELSKPGSVSYAFRWEAKTKPKGEEMAPFVQIVLSPAGEVMSFNDIRSLYYQN